jgi:uncharacterized membrane protein YphA (DoxX/SURF4 family)
MTTKDHLAEFNPRAATLLPTAASGATLLRLILAAYWIVHWWYKVGFEGMPATEIFFIKNGLPAWLAWFDIIFEVIVAVCLILGLYVSLICLVSLPILCASMIMFAGNGFYFPMGGIELRTSGLWPRSFKRSWDPAFLGSLRHVPVFPALGP